MTGKKLYYSIFVIILTIITVIIILQFQIKTYTPNPEIFDKLNTDEKYAEEEYLQKDRGIINDKSYNNRIKEKNQAAY
jgi:cell division protein FtsL